MGALAAIQLFGVAVLVFYYAALFKIITKAGYHGAWVLVVVAPTVVTWIALRSLTSAVQNAELVVVADVLFALATIVLFFVFAFSEWPVLREVRRLREASALAGVESPAVSAAPAPMIASTSMRLPAAPDGSSECRGCHESVGPDDAFCTWCGTPVD